MEELIQLEHKVNGMMGVCKELSRHENVKILLVSLLLLMMMIAREFMMLLLLLLLLMLIR